MISLLLSRKMIFIFPKNMILFFSEKMKNDLSQKKITWKFIFFKKLHWNIIFLVLSGKKVFFPLSENVISFSFGGKIKDDLSQEIH